MTSNLIFDLHCTRVTRVHDPAKISRTILVLLLGKQNISRKNREFLGNSLKKDQVNQLLIRVGVETYIIRIREIRVHNR